MGSGRYYVTDMGFVPKGKLIHFANILYINYIIIIICSCDATFFRHKVMKILKEVDPEGLKQREKRRLKRRLYRNKVSISVASA